MRVLLSLCLSFLLFIANASHIVGGELTYKYISKANNEDVTYTITLNLYLDCDKGDPSAIQTDAQGFINVFDAKTGALLRNLCKTVNRNNPERVSDNAYKCIKNKPNLCVDMYSYVTNMVLPKRANGYIISFERCCRNNAIANIVNPNLTGATYWTEIKPEASTGKNSSPIFKSRPPVFLCLNAPFVFDHSGYDEDGDSLVYELFTPFIGGSDNRPRPDYSRGFNGTPTFPSANRTVKWSNTYSETNQMGGNPILEIDPVTGRLTVTPTQSNQFVIGIKVKEYRNGVLIGETKRDYQFNVSNCVFDVISVFYTAKTNCTNSGIILNNLSSGAAGYHWDFGVQGTDIDTSNQKSPSYNYSKPGNYTITLIAKNTVCIDTFDFTVTIKQNIKTFLGNDTTFCQTSNLILDAGNPGKQFLWNTGQISQSITVDKSGYYWVTVSDDPCEAKDTIKVVMDLSTLNLGSDSFICRDEFPSFTYTIADTFNNYLWNTSSQNNQVDVVKPGKYWLSIINNNGCARNDTIEFFHVLPPKINLRDTSICIEDEALFDAKFDNYVYLWNTGESTKTISTKNPGTYWVKIDNSFCSTSDTAILGIIDPGLQLPKDTFFCGNFNYEVLPNKKFVSYLWSNGDTSYSTIISTKLNLGLTIQNKEGCFQSDSININQFPALDGFILGDTVACTASILTLETNDNMDYAWSTGEDVQSIQVKDQGIYFVILTDQNNCKDTVYHKITKNPALLPNEVYMPNVFTPNGDLLNDEYPNNKFKDVQSIYELQIFNRWGEKLYETSSPNNNWDGTYRGAKCENGSYIYTLSYLGCDNSRHFKKGSFLILR